jgi:acetyl-CoA hydrolase
MKILDPANMSLAQIVRPGDTVIWGQAAAEPVPLTTALMAERHAIGGFSAFIGTTWSDAITPDCGDQVAFSSYCGAGANRALAKAGKLDILPCHYSQFGQLMRSGRLKVDVILLQVAGPDTQGLYSLSMAHEYLVPALDMARVVIAEINAAAPWTHGTTISADQIDFAVLTERPPVELPPSQASDIDIRVARHVVELIEDGSTLQVGIGALPEAILSQLFAHKDIGIHSGTIGDQVAALAEMGVVTNARKSIDRNVTVTGVLMGGSACRRYVHRNPAVQFRSVDYTHNANVLARINKFVAINSALEVDLTGQVNAEVAGGIYLGAVGGAVDFIRGAHASHGGLPVIALGSTAGGSRLPTSRIVSRLGGPVSTPRCDAGLIVTEWGVADLRGLTLEKRVEKMIGVAHPEFRAKLEQEGALLLGNNKTA